MSSTLDDAFTLSISPALGSTVRSSIEESVFVTCTIHTSLPLKKLQPKVWTNLINEHNPRGEWHSIDMIYKASDSNENANEFAFGAELIPNKIGSFEYTVQLESNDHQVPGAVEKNSVVHVDVLPTWMEIYYSNGARSEDYDTVMLIEKKDPEAGHYGWILAKSFDPTKHPDREHTPWDFSPDRQENLGTETDTWIKSWFEEGGRVITDPGAEEKWKEIIESFQNSPFYKISDDSMTTYGDGGEAYLIYPVWKCDNLAISPETKKSLNDHLHTLSEIRKDYQKLSPVQDIIDPDLAPYVLPKEEYQQELERLADIGSRGEPEELIPQFSDNIKIRSSYQWIPSEFEINAQGKVSINSRIHNLPLVAANETLYFCIKQVFEAMVPMFGKLNLIKTGQTTNLQVIVKAQSYNLLPEMTYAGRWHMEGQTENIVAAGVYYSHVGSELKGGNLKFRPSHGPQPLYEFKTDQQVTIEEGTAVVFSNTLPHRFRKITNNSSLPQRRTFINFFIVDPSKPITSTKEIPDGGFLSKAMQHYVRQNLHKILPPEIASYIVSWIPGVWESISSAKELRQKARQAMIEDKSGWGWVHWGNSGNVEFVSSLSTLDPYDASEFGELLHTDSDLNEAN